MADGTETVNKEVTDEAFKKYNREQAIKLGIWLGVGLLITFLAYKAFIK
jgi:hypothetical protein